MKRLLIAFLAAVSLSGLASAEPARTPYEGMEYYKTYNSSNVTSTSGRIAYSSYLHKVIISSAAAVTGTGGSTVAFYNANGSATGLAFAVSLSTNDITGPQDYTMDIWMSSGIYAVNMTTGQVGSMQVTYMRNSAPNNAKIWQSSWSYVDVATHTLAGGPVLLHSVKVLTKGTGTTSMRLYNSQAAAPASNSILGQVDLTAVGEYDFDVLFSSGLTINCASIGSATPAGVLLTFKRNPPRDWEVWRSTMVTGTITNVSLGAGQYVLGGVVNGTANDTGQLTIYDSNGTANNKIAEVDAVLTFGKKMFDVVTSSGITVTHQGTGTFSVLYRKK